MSELLNYKLQGQGPTLVLIHGLFGSLDNLGLLARDLSRDYQVLSVDLRNHGLSFHSDQHDYPAMAADIHRLTTQLGLSSLHLIGHSMGGKVAMRFAADYPEQIASLTVMDMAPVAYSEARHDEVFAALEMVEKHQPTTRSQAMALLAEHITLEGVRQFLGKSLVNNEGYLSWRFNLAALKANYWNILGWQPVTPCELPTLFLKGADSDYLTAEHQSAVQAQYPRAKAHVIAGTGHWLHAEKPQAVIRAIRRFLTNLPG